MRVRVCLAAALLCSSGCFLDHGATDPPDPGSREGAPFEGVCSLGPAAGYPKTLALYRTADCRDPMPRDACEVAGPTPVMDGPPRFSVSTSAVTTPDDGPACDTVARIARSGQCELPIDGVGSYDVVIDGRYELALSVPYDSPDGASCWVFGGDCLTGAAPAYGLPSYVTAEEAHVFDLTVVNLDAPRPTACVVTVEDGGVGGPVKAPRVRVTMRGDETADATDCDGGARRVRCLVPPLAAGDYDVVLPSGETRSLTAG